jgi:hypothetical protein
MFRCVRFACQIIPDICKTSFLIFVIHWTLILNSIAMLAVEKYNQENHMAFYVPPLVRQKASCSAELNLAVSCSAEVQ